MLRPGLYVSLSLFGFLLFPAAVFLMRLASSYALGVVAVAAMLVVLELGARRCMIQRGALIWIYAVLVLALLHLIYVTGSTNFWSVRALVSLLFLLVVVLAVNFTAGHAARMPPEEFHKVIRRAVVLMLVLGTTNAILKDPLKDLNGWRAVMTPFSEPSHYAIALAPFALYAVAMRDRWLIAGFFVTLAIVLSQMGSVIILVVALLVVGLLLPFWVTLLAFPVLGAVVAATLTSEYYLSRLAFWEGENLTALVYLQGLQIIGESFTGSNITGLGFQQLGSRDLGLEASKVIRGLRDGQDSNILDGGFVAAKLIGEFGLLALPLTLGLVVLMVRSFALLRRHRSGKRVMEPMHVFAHCCIFGYFVEFGFRGIGYFSVGTTFLLLAPFLLTAQRGGPVQVLAQAVAQAMPRVRAAARQRRPS